MRHALAACALLLYAGTAWAQTNTPTPTATPTPANKDVFFLSLHGMQTSNTTYHSTGTNSTTEADVQMAIVARTVSNLYVTCAAAISSGSVTYTWRKNGASQTLTCTVADGQSGCSDTTHSFETADGDLVDVMAEPADGPAADPICHASVRLTAVGSTTAPAHPIMLWAGLATDFGGGGTTYCAPGSGSDTSEGCSGTSTAISWTMPTAGSVSRLMVRLYPDPNSAVSETLTVHNKTDNVDVVSVTVDNGETTAQSASCAANCAYDANERLRINRGSTDHVDAVRSILVEYYTTRNVVVGDTTLDLTHTNPVYYGPHAPDLAAGLPTPGRATYRLPHDVRITALDFITDAAVSQGTAAITVCQDQSTSPPTCTSDDPACTVAEAGTACSDTATSDLDAGGYVAVQAGPVETPNNTRQRWCWEYIDQPTETPTPTITDTPTVTHTPTNTPTNTPLNCAVRGQASCRIPQYFAPLGDASGNKATFHFFGAPVLDDTAEAALTPTPGWVIYNSTDDKMRGYTTAGWADFHP